MSRCDQKWGRRADDPEEERGRGPTRWEAPPASARGQPAKLPSRQGGDAALLRSGYKGAREGCEVGRPRRVAAGASLLQREG